MHREDRGEMRFSGIRYFRDSWISDEYCLDNGEMEPIVIDSNAVSLA